MSKKTKLKVSEEFVREAHEAACDGLKPGTWYIDTRPESSLLINCIGGCDNEDGTHYTAYGFGFGFDGEWYDEIQDWWCRGHLVVATEDELVKAFRDYMKKERLERRYVDTPSHRVLPDTDHWALGRLYTDTPYSAIYTAEPGGGGHTIYKNGVWERPHISKKDAEVELNKTIIG